MTNPHDLSPDVSSETDEAISPPPAEHPRYPAEHLRFVERFAVGLNRRLNQRGIPQKIAALWQRCFAQVLVRVIYQKRLHHINIENLAALPPRASILLVANHRTFFDLFVVAMSLRLTSKMRLGVPCAFPVRSTFFYDNILGVLINFLNAGGCMYPPVFRDERRATLNPIGVDIMRWLLTQPHVTLGIHPEGHRSKSDDIYTLEPPKRGVGQLIQGCHDQLYVLPVFVEGLNNSFSHEVKQRLKRSPDPIYIRWGKPYPASTHQGSDIEIADQVHARIQELADQARAEHHQRSAS